MRKKPILTISFLASRHSEDVKRCIDSLKPIRKALPCEVIAVDTSEGDEELRKLLDQCVDQVVPFTWCDDFAKARNAGLACATGEWFLYIDDDEWFTDTDQIIQFFKQGGWKKYDGANYLVRNFLNMQGTQWTDSWVSRMVRISPETHFTSPIHEYLSPIPAKIVALDSMAYHYGYAYATAEDRRRHFERNSTLLLKMVHDEPGNMRWRLQLLMEYASVCDWNQLYDLADEGIELIQKQDNCSEEGARGAFFAAKILVLEMLGDHKKSHELSEFVLSDENVNQLARAFAYFYKGKCEMRLRCFPEMEESVQQYLRWKEYFDQHKEMLINQGNVPFVGTIFERQKLQQAYLMLICAGLKRRDISYLQQYWEKLDFGDGCVAGDTLFPECMIEAMADMPKEEIFIRVLQAVSGNDALWNIFRLGLLKWVMERRAGSQCFISLLQKAGVDASFLKVYDLRNQLCHFPGDQSDEELQRQLNAYVSLANAYFRDSYSAQLESGQVEELPPDYRAVLSLQRLLKEDELEKKLALVKQVVEAYPPLGETMKRYARILQQKEVLQTDPQTIFKLQLMSQQIMKQIPVLLESGQIEEAKGVVQQLRMLLPGDEQIRELAEQIQSRE